MEQVKLEDLSEVENKLYEKAYDVRENAYAPYSGFKVGAALVTDTGKIFSGCNVESVDLTLTTHAEMNAIDSMIAAGEKKIQEIVIVMVSEVGYGMPCGLCRQKILEFAVQGTVIIGINLKEDGSLLNINKTSIEEVLPFAFGPEVLQD